jgi:hypothetical protein
MAHLKSYFSGETHDAPFGWMISQDLFAGRKGKVMHKPVILRSRLFYNLARWISDGVKHNLIDLFNSLIVLTHPYLSFCHGVK